ncbi:MULTISPECIES: CU044_2847 family protein [Fischerella]|uniref:CU044_2847 family protein n=1 Tax=Fischerella TaxID=1190 RepID=UPI0022847CF3|nr:CU044_2847 family protein [Fischerella muscicola]
MQEFHDKLRGYTKLALGAFKNLPEAEEVTIKFGIKLGGKVGIPILAEGSTEGNFEIEVKCKFPDKYQNSGSI